jgi:predicted RNA-binding Zn-ribbon protein involved in translation (DUF1610 family)
MHSTHNVSVSSHFRTRWFGLRPMLACALGFALAAVPSGLRANGPKAQNGQTPPPAAPAPPASPAITISGIPQITTHYMVDDETLKTRVELEAKEMSVVDALKSVLEQAKVKYEIDADVPTNKKITMTLKNVPLSFVLGLLTREAEIGWHYMKKDKESSIKITKNKQNIFAIMPGGAMRVESTQRLVDEAMARASAATAHIDRLTWNAYYPAPLPEKLVKIDVRNGNVRDIFKDVLKQADLDYALEDDVPEDVKKSFTFENIPIGMALDVISRSAEVGWRSERQGRGKEAKTIVRIGKKYVARRTIYGSATYPATIPAPVAMPLPVTEQRVSFTCPHCKSKVRVVRDTKDEKQKAWKFCPVCGKPVDVQSYLGPTPIRFNGDTDTDVILDMRLHHPMVGFSRFVEFEPFTAEFWSEESFPLVEFEEPQCPTHTGIQSHP